MKISQHRAVTSQIERSQLRWFGNARKHNTLGKTPQTSFTCYLPKQMGKDLLDDLELDGPITLMILDGIAWDFTQAK